MPFRRPGCASSARRKAAAQLEASKVFAKKLMRHADVPTAEFRVFDHPDPARHYIETREYPVVVKADGLAAGKGVIVCSHDRGGPGGHRAHHGPRGVRPGRRPAGRHREAAGRRGAEHPGPGRRAGPSCRCRRRRTTRRAFDDDHGPEHRRHGRLLPGPARHAGTAATQIETTVLVPTVHAMKRSRRPFRGVLYAGVMVTNQGPRVLEFNCRFGDPETQPLLMRLRTDLLDLLEAVVDDRLDEFAEGRLEWDPRPAVCVVMASQGYPGSYAKGKVITRPGRGGEAAGREGLPRRHASWRTAWSSPTAAGCWA